MDLLAFDKMFKCLYYHQFISSVAQDFPPRYQNLVSPMAKVYITGYSGKFMLDFLRDETTLCGSLSSRRFVADSVSDVIAGHRRDIFFDFSFKLESRRLLSLLPYPKKEVFFPSVSGWQEAQNKGCLKTYFGHYDWLGITKNDSDKEYPVIYNNDYSVYLQSLDKFFLMERYLVWMRENNCTLPIENQDYSNPLNFVDYFFRQIGQYMDIIRNNLTRRYYIVGDGPGTASVACMMLSVQYVSMEPNSIGDKARLLGIITSDELPELFKDDIVFLANVGDFVDYSLYDAYDKIIVDYSGKEQVGLVRAYGGRGSVYTSLEISLTAFPRRSNCLGLLKGKKINPLTPLSKQICLENGINNFSDKDDAYTVTTDAYSDHMNLISMELPSDARAKKGHVKKHMGVFFHYWEEGQKVFGDDCFTEYNPKSYSTIKYVRQYYIDGEIIHAISPRPEKVRGVYMDDGRIMKLFYISSYVLDGKTYGRYKSLELMFRAEI